MGSSAPGIVLFNLQQRDPNAGKMQEITQGYWLLLRSPKAGCCHLWCSCVGLDGPVPKSTHCEKSACLSVSSWRIYTSRCWPCYSRRSSLPPLRGSSRDRTLQQQCCGKAPQVSRMWHTLLFLHLPSRGPMIAIGSPLCRPCPTLLVATSFWRLAWGRGPSNHGTHQICLHQRISGTSVCTEAN